MAVKLDRIRFKTAEYSFTTHNAIIPQEHSLEDVKEPEYWSIVTNSGLMRDGDEIRMVWEDDSRLIRAFVIHCQKQWARIKILEDFSLIEEAKQIPEAVPSGYKVKWRGRHHRFGVFKDDGNSDFLVKGENAEFYTRSEAEAWLREHLKAIA